MFRGGTIRYTNAAGNERTFSVAGPEAAAAGIFLRFSPSMDILGLRTYHRLITFRGNGENKYHYSSPGADWLAPYADWFYLFVYRNQKNLGVVEAFYTESPYFAGGKRTIFVTHSGYIVQ